MAQQATETTKKYRVQLDFSEEAFQELNDLVAKLRAPSRADVIRNALGVLKWVYKKKVEQGCDVVAISKQDDGQDAGQLFAKGGPRQAAAVAGYEHHAGPAAPLRVFEPEFTFIPEKR